MRDDTSGECVRDCGTFAFDEFLDQCSETYPQDLQDINERLDNLQEEVNNIEDTDIPSITNQITNNIIPAIEAVDNRIDNLVITERSQNVLIIGFLEINKDDFIVFLLMLNFIVISTFGYYLCCISTKIAKPKKQKYKEVKVFSSDDENQKLNL